MTDQPDTQSTNPEPDPVGADPVDQTDTDDNPSHEAAKWRTQLRAAEAQRDSLLLSLAAQQTSMVDLISAATLVDPGDLWRHGANLADLLNDEGAVDPDKVTEAVQALTGQRPHLAKSVRPRPDRSQASGATGPHDEALTWANALRR